MSTKSSAEFPVATPTIPVYISPGRPILYPLRESSMPSSPAKPIDRSPPSGTAAALSLSDTIRLANGALAEHRLLAMASDLWESRPEASDPHWIAAAWNGLVVAYRLDT